MANTIKVRFKGQDHWRELDSKDINIFCHQGYQDLEFDGVYPIDPEQATYHGRLVKVLHPETMRYVRMVFSESVSDRDYEWLESILLRDRQGSGMIHVLGLIDFTLKLIDSHVSFAWIRPEATLHPHLHLRIANVMIHIQKNYKSRNILLPQIREVMEANG